MMIPYYGISQEKYIINSDTIIGFNNAEIRQIALIFIEGERTEELLFNAQEIISYKDSIITILGNKVIFTDSTLQVTYSLLEDVSNDLTKEKDRVRKRNNWLTGSIIGNVVLILILLL